MSGGYNSAFLTAMRGNGTQIPYLRNHIFASEPGILHTDSGQRLVNLKAGFSGIEVCDAPTTRSMFSHPFNAWWLPNKSRVATEVNLGAIGADIFFTPALTGCVLEINGTIIKHHDGYSPTRAGALVLNLGGGVGRRRWDNDGIAPGFFASVVIGVRRNGTWEFYQQSYDYNQVRTGMLPAAQVTRI